MQPRENISDPKLADSNFRVQREVKVNWLFNVTINDISVIYVTDVQAD